MHSTGKNLKTRDQKGFTLLVAVMITSLLLVVSFVVANVALKQLLISQSSEESQYAFYNAESGVECALYWDFAGGASQFDLDAAGAVNCNGQTVWTGSQTVASPASVPSLVGGGGAGNPTSIFSINLTRGCVIVRVTKDTDGDTTIDSRGYNICSGSSPRRLERAVELTY